MKEICGFDLRVARNSGYCPINHLRHNYMITVRSLLIIKRCGVHSVAAENTAVRWPRTLQLDRVAVS